MARGLFAVTFVLFFSFAISFAEQNPSQAQQNQVNPANSPDAAVIQDSGSTNTSGYRLVVYASGKAEWSLFRRRGAQNCGRKNGDLLPELTQNFFQDLRALAPLSNLPARHCIKSVSFGHTLRVTYQGTSSPDLSCPGGRDESAKLLDDVAKIRNALGIGQTLGGLPAECGQPIVIPKP